MVDVSMDLNHIDLGLYFDGLIGLFICLRLCLIGLFICMMVCDWFIYLSLMVCDWFIFRLHQSQFLCVLSPEKSGWGWLSVWILFHCYRGKEEKRDLCNLSLCLFVVCLKNTDIYLKNFFLKKGNHFKFQRDNTFFNCV